MFAGVRLLGDYEYRQVQQGRPHNAGWVMAHGTLIAWGSLVAGGVILVAGTYLLAVGR